MCGIAGEINFSKKATRNNLILQSLTHRGPDNSSYIKVDNNVSFYHTRLKIIDLTDNSNQPMSSEDKRYTITYNGELYNYLELRAKLVKLGFKFKTTGDTEVFLKGFIKYKKNFFKLAEGIFAVSIFDKIEKKVYFARDFIGVKPLYYTFSEKHFSFSSELKSLLIFRKDSNILDKNNINEFLYYKYISGKNTLIKNIFKFDPGKVYWIDLKKKKINLKSFKYYSFKEKNNKSVLQDDVKKTKFLINNSVKLQLQSDANIGIQLSGGVDSTLLTEVAKDKRKIKHLYCSTFKNYINDEYLFAKQVSNKLNIPINKIQLTKEFFFKNIDKSIFHLDEPLNHPHSLAIMQISKEAKKDISVMLAGEGADEVFFGYERYSLINNRSKIKDVLLNGAFLRTNQDLEFFKYFSKRQYGDPHLNRLKIFNSLNIDNNIKKFQVFESYTHLQSLLLRSDKMMMANSIEARVPFLDSNIFDYGINLNDSLKKNIKQKILLKKVLKEYGYNSSFINRKKIGYLVPFNNWLAQKNINILNKCEIANSLFEQKYINFISDNIYKKKEVYSSAKIFWLILNLTKFIKKFNLNY